MDITSIGAAALAESAGLPWAQWIPLFQHFSYNGARADSITRAVRNRSCGHRRAHGPRIQVGLRPVLGGEDVWPAPLNLYLTAPPFQDPDLTLPESFRVVCPASWEPPTSALDLLANCPDPVVLVTASSEYQPDPAIIETALAALADEPGTAICTTAAHDPSSFDALPKGRIERWLPQLQILERASGVVCHGGMGITQKALAAGVPVCVVPFGRDQFEVARRIATEGAGTVVPPDQLTPANLRRPIAEAATMRSGARRIAASFAAWDAASGAATAVEALGRVAKPLT